jgi:chorismate-pyruvate lyase
MKSTFRKLCCTGGALLLGSLAVRANDQATPTPPWPDTYLSRVEALALLQTLDADLLSHDSATLTLERWCGAHRLAIAPRIVAERVTGVNQQPSAEQRQELGINAGEPVRYRRVKLLCGALVLSEADNWYVPARLTPDMNRTLDTTNTPFGKVVQALHFQRHTLSSTLLWLPLPDGWEMSAVGTTAGASSLTIPPAVLENKAVLSLPDGTPFSEVVETYSSNVLAFPPPGAPH